MAYGSILGQTPNLSDYVTNDQLTTKLNNYLPLNGGTMTGNINMNRKRLNNVPTPTSSLQAANKQYVDNQLSNYVTNNSLSDQLNNYLELSGGTMTGSLNMNGQKITNIPDGVNSGDAVNFGQLSDISDADLFNLSGLSVVKESSGNFTTSSYSSGSYFYESPTIITLSTRGSTLRYFKLKFLIVQVGYYYGSSSGYSYNPSYTGVLYTAGNGNNPTNITNNISLVTSRLNVSFHISSSIFANAKFYYNIKEYG